MFVEADVNPGVRVLSKGGDINARDNNNRTPLIAALTTGHKDLANLLLSQGAEPDLIAASILGRADRVATILKESPSLVNLKGPCGTPLHCACIYGTKEVAETLLAHGADVNAKSRDDSTPLHWAARRGRTELVKLLIAKGADVRAMDKNGWTPLHLAGYGGHSRETVELLLAHGGECDVFTTVALKDRDRLTAMLNTDSKLVHAIGPEKLTPLHWAVWLKWKEGVELLLSKGADSKARSSSGTPAQLAITYGLTEIEAVLRAERIRRTAAEGKPDALKTIRLHGAVRDDDLELVRSTLDANVEFLNVKDAQGWTPLKLALARGRKEIVDLLLAKGAEVDLFDAISLGDPDRVKQILQPNPTLINSTNSFGTTPLSAAAGKGDKAIVELLIAKGADVRAKDTHRNWTALHVAASRCNKEAAAVLLANGADVEATDNHGMRPMHWAAQWPGRGPIVEALLAKGAEVNVKDEWMKRTPLHWATDHGTRDTVARLMTAGASLGIRDRDGHTPLHVAVVHGHKEIVKLFMGTGTGPDFFAVCALGDLARAGGLLKSDPLLVHATLRLRGCSMGSKLFHGGEVPGDPLQDSGSTGLHWAACAGQGKVVQLLLSKGADVNAANEFAETPLHLSAGGGHSDLVQFLIAKGARVNATNNHGQTPLRVAIESCHEKVADLLRKHGGKGTGIPCPDPIHQAAEEGDVAKLRELLKKDHRLIESKGWQGDTPLHDAVSASKMEAVEFLLSQGAQINPRNDHSQTPLHLAVSRFPGNMKITRLLLAKGAEVNAKDKYECTPLHTAADLGDLDAVELLISSGGDLKAVDKEGRTPRERARVSDNEDILTLLERHGVRK